MHYALYPINSAISRQTFFIKCTLAFMIKVVYSKTVEETYKRDQKVLSGTKYLLETLERVTGDHNNAKEILDKIFRIIGKGDVIQRLTRC